MAEMIQPYFEKSHKMRVMIFDSRIDLPESFRFMSKRFRIRFFIFASSTNNHQNIVIGM